ncbi:uncharacterized protein CG43867 isoform X4 [Chrysoperla carnea]|uniref:uncharacterized protein CG43867 isoform X4 n=1 Tax=Chrysoperla carnea TaxID=189513 RepID=UPI001D08927E|nr:uncharacterized protein CG43867 isoform X4 [Chrysoperla carnea]
MADELSRGGSPARRLSQIFDPLSRLTEYTHPGSPGATGLRSQTPGGHHVVTSSHSTPSSPRLLPRRSRLNQTLGGSASVSTRANINNLVQTSSSSSASGGASSSSGMHYYSPQHHHHDMLLDSESSSWSSDSGVNWQERCLELQLELHRSRNQATRVRDMLRDKLSELEQRVLDAEGRAEEAEDKVRMMEERLAVVTSSTWAAGEGPPEQVQERQQVITKLETQVEEQRQLRLQDAKQVEAKAARIKEWVTNKLRELEEQNQLLREQNLKCNQQLELLRNHIATQGLRASSVLPIRNSLSLDVRENESPPPRSLSSLRRRSESLEASPTPQNHIVPEPLYSKIEPSSTRHRRHQSMCSTITNKVMDPKDVLTDDLTAAVEGLVILPSEPVRISTDGDTTHDYAEIYTPNREKTPGWIRDPSSHCDGSTSSTNSGSISELASIPKPPTPPLHRFPSWEAKIYQVAAEGLQLTGSSTQSTEVLTQHQNGTVVAGASRIQQTASGGYCDISVPVYATVKGRASQIRSMPFTGDSSDDSESDGEGDHGVSSTGALLDSTIHTRATNSSSDHTDSSLSGGSASSPSKSLKTASSLSPAKRSSSGSPSKCKTRDTSFESGMSDDYAIPPDAMSCDTTSIESSMPSLLMRVSSYMDSPNKRVESLEKSGHLAKLGGKLKTWRKRWFVLKNGVLSYWKTQNDVNRKPQGQIVLDEICRITRADGAATFEISTGKKTYYLTADSIATMEDWIRVLQNVQRRNATKLLLSKEDNKPSVQGWLTKVKNGHAKKCWCVLIGKMFLYFKSPNDSNPVGQINMRDARVEEVDHMSDSDSEEREGEGQALELTVGIFPTHQGPTYLLFPSKQEKDNWLYHLTVVSGGGPSAGTQYEQLVQKLMETDGDPSCVLWRHPQLLHSKENIVSPLTSLNSEALQAEAIKLFKCCQLFMSVAVEQAGIDYHVVLAQNALQQCLDVPDLQTELMCALVKQTSKHTTHKLGVQVNRAVSKLKPSRQLLLCATQSLFTCDSASGTSAGVATQKGSPTSIQAPPAPILDCKTNPPTYSFVQGWQLLALAVSLFVPKNNRLLWYLKLHLQRNADSKSECGKYAAYCERALERTLQNGGREVKPSRMEVLSILLKNPYHHSLPHAIPVHMLNGAYQVVSFDGSTTIEEFLTTLNQEIGCRESTISGFTLFSDDPIEKDLEHYLDPQAKLCDVISKWETALREKGSGKFENTRVIQLTYKNRLYWRHAAKMETDRERLLFCYQINQQVVQGRFPINRELALELASLMAQIDFGEYNTDKGRGSGGQGNPNHSVLCALDKFYPYRYRDALSPDGLKDLQERLMEKWISLKGRSLIDCVRIYLTCTRKWPFFGATLFQAKLKQSEPIMVWLAVAEDSVTLLELATMTVLVRYPYASVVTFGGCQDDFMLVVCPEESEGSQKLLFSLSKPKILELTLLIADYMNALGHALPGTPQMNTLTRNGSHRSIRSRPPQATQSVTHVTISTGHNTLSSTLGHSTTQATAHTTQQPDILKSTPDHHASVVANVTPRAEKKRTHLDSGVA